MRRRCLISLAVPSLLAAAGGARAQRREPLRLTWISLGPHPFIDDFRAGLRDLGMIEGTHYALASLYPAGSDAEEVMRLASRAIPTTDLFVASGGAVARAVRQADARAPMIGVVSEPVALGLARNVARPGSNYSGIAIEAIETGPKSLELLKSGFPSIARVLLLTEATVTGRRQRELIGQAATALRLELVEVPVVRPEDIDTAAVRGRESQVDAVMVPASPFFSAQRDRLLTLGSSLGLPAMYEHRAFAEAGGLLCHGPNIAAAFRRLASYVDRIRRGETPDSMPIDVVSRVELVINRRTARAQKLVVSQELLTRADEVIE